MKKGTLVFYLCLLGLAAAFLFASLGITPLSALTATSDGAYPIVISCLSLAFALAALLGLRKQAKGADGPDGEDAPVLHPDVLVMILLLGGYFAAIVTIHYSLATLLFTVLSISYLEQWRWRRGLLIGFTATFWVVLVFKYLFHVILP